MNKRYLLWIISLLLIVWGCHDFYNYVTVGKELLVMYEGVQSVKELVRYNLIHGAVTICIGAVIAAIAVLKGKQREQ